MAKKDRKPLRKHHVRFRDSEWTVIAERARECGWSISRYIRETALGMVPKARPNQWEEKAIYQLTKIGANLNQLSHRAHLREEIPSAEEFNALREKIVAMIDDLGGRFRRSKGTGT